MNILCGRKNFEAAGLEQTPEYGFGKTPLTKYLRHILVLRPGIVVIYDEMELVGKSGGSGSFIVRFAFR